MIIEQFKKAVKNPMRILYRFRDQITRRRNIDSLLHHPVRYFPSDKKKVRVLMAVSQYDYGDRHRGISYEENNFTHTLIHAGYEVIAFETLDTMRRFGKKMMNELLVENVYRWQPDIVFFSLYRDEVEPETLNTLRTTVGVKTLNWFSDDHWRFDEFTRIYAPHVSYSVTTDVQSLPKYNREGIHNVIHSQWACNHYLYRKLPVETDNDVTFVGQPHGDRRQMIHKMKKAGIPVEAYGYGWRNGRLSTFQMIEMFNRTRINLNVGNSSKGERDQIKGRDFEIPGCGGFMIRGNNEQLRDYYLLEDELVVYDDLNDLIDKLHYYLEHDDEREMIRKKCYRRVLSDHTYEKRFETIFKKIGLL